MKRPARRPIRFTLASVPPGPLTAVARRKAGRVVPTGKGPVVPTGKVGRVVPTRRHRTPESLIHPSPACIDSRPPTRQARHIVPRRRPHGYTLIEVLTAAVIIGVSLSAAVSMSTTMMMQEELSQRVTQSLNYQENAARLWQLGLSPLQAAALMPGTSGNPVLTRALATTGSTNALGTSDVDGIGALESATNSIEVNNFASQAGTGDTTSVTVFRPTTR